MTLTRTATMSGNYIDEPEEISKRSKRLRMLCAIIVTIVSILLIIATIVLLVVFIPSNPYITVYKLEQNAFDLLYCPSNISYACCSTTSCQFQYSNLVFNQTLFLSINNYNHLPLSYGGITVTTKYSGIVYSQNTFANGHIPSGENIVSVIIHKL